MSKTFLLLIAALIFATSCKQGNDDDDDDNTPTSSTNYIPMSIGNYWVYEIRNTDSLGVPNGGTAYLDSIEITHDTLIKGNKFFVFEGDYGNSSQPTRIIKNILRDSSGFLVNEVGEVLFSSTNFIDTLSKHIDIHNTDTIYEYYGMMENPSYQITVPSGTYDVLDFKTTIIYYRTRYMHKYFADGIGEIYNNLFFSSSSNMLERRLIRYYIK